jgi:hypothetical protein
MATYDIEVAAIGVATVSAVAANWQTLDLSTIPANSVTAAQTGADVAFIEIDNLSAASGVGLKLYNVGGNPGIDGNTLKIPAGASYTLSKVTGIKYVSLKGQTGNASVEVRVHSHQTVTHSPWPA